MTPVSTVTTICFNIFLHHLQKEVVLKGRMHFGVREP
jgi:hypothetical protein